MNILIDFLPTCVEIDNKKYEINSDFRTSILFELMIEDEALSDEDKLYATLDLYYKELPQNIKEAIEKALWFYKGGKEDIQIINSFKTKKSIMGSDTKIYSFEYDADYIYSAFLTQYHIDLQDISYLHWWKFKAMFKSLKEDNEIVKIMGYRSMDINKIEDKTQRKFYKEMKELYKLPEKSNDKDDKKLRELEEILMNDGDLSKW